MLVIYQFLKTSFLDPLFLVVMILGIGLIMLRFYKGKYIIFIPRLLFVAFLVLFIFGISPVNNFLFYLLEKDYIRPDIYNVEKLDVVVVLSGGSYKNQKFKDVMPSHETPQRLMHALQIFNLSNAKFIVFSGKNKHEISTDRHKISTAGVMGQVARRIGILDTQIVIESKATNTMMHAKEVNKIFEDKDLKIGLVTSAYHMKRSHREFGRYFNNIIPLASGYYYAPQTISPFIFIPSSFNLYKSFIAIRELVGNVWYRIRY